MSFFLRFVSPLPMHRRPFPQTHKKKAIKDPSMNIVKLKKQMPFPEP